MTKLYYSIINWYASEINPSTFGKRVWILALASYIALC